MKMKTITIYLCVCISVLPGHWPNELRVRQWSGRLRFNPSSSHTKDSKKTMVPDIVLLNTQHYEVRVNGKMEQSKEWKSALGIPRYSNYRKGPLSHPRLRSPTLIYMCYWSFSFSLESSQENFLISSFPVCSLICVLL